MQTNKNQIEIVSENELDKSLIKKIKALLGESAEVNTKVDSSKFKQKIMVTTASKLSEDLVKKVQDIFGKNTEIITHVDESVIGGILIKTKEKMYDGTIRGQLNKLKNNL